MMSCVNRSCNRPISTFSEGRLFHFEILSISVAADDSKKRDFDEVPHREGVHFWLCGPCATDMTLVLEPVGGLQLLPLEHALEHSPQTSSDALSGHSLELVGAHQG
jgi:hypothetical protein